MEIFSALLALCEGGNTYIFHDCCAVYGYIVNTYAASDVLEMQRSPTELTYLSKNIPVASPERLVLLIPACWLWAQLLC